ncbi:MAG: hypothetical protein ACREU3_17630, partial [Steroidobacteraceae bacterium]
MATPASASSRSLDPAGDAGATAHPPAKPLGEAVAVTTRDDFLLELGEALGGAVAVRPVDTLDAALEQLAGARRLTILLIDSREAQDLRAEVARAHARAPHVPLVVFGPADTEQSVASALKSSSAFAILPVPMDPRKTAAILEGAFAEASAKRSGSAAGSPVASSSAARAPLAPDAATAGAAPSADVE